MRDLTELDKYRDVLMERHAFGSSSPESRKVGGFFFIPTKGVRQGLKVIASSGTIPTSNGWDHVSVSLPNRTPTWEEMDKVKRLFFLPHEVAFQLHPEESDHISNHRYCLHIWNNIFQPVPMPPPEMVGNSKIGDVTSKKFSPEEVQQEQMRALYDMASR